MTENEAVAEKKPLWRRIVDFPLVAMLIATVLVLLTVALSSILTGLLPRASGLNPHLLFNLICGTLLVTVYLVAIRRLGERPRNDFHDRHALQRLLLGLGAGFALFSVAVALAAALGVYRISGWGDLSNVMPALIASAIFPAISEEMVFRGILFRWIEEFGGSWAALVLTSLLFGASHLMNPNASIIAAVGIALEAGVMLGAAYMLTRSLWLPMGIHAAWNFTQGEIYDIPVSGTPVHGLLDAQLTGPPLLTGAGFGLEASLFAIIPATLFGLWLLWRAIAKGELVQPRWVRRQAMATLAAT